MNSNFWDYSRFRGLTPVSCETAKKAFHNGFYVVVSSCKDDFRNDVNENIYNDFLYENHVKSFVICNDDKTKGFDTDVNESIDFHNDYMNKDNICFYLFKDDVLSYSMNNDCDMDFVKTVLGYIPLWLQYQEIAETDQEIAEIENEINETDQEIAEIDSNRKNLQHDVIFYNTVGLYKKAENAERLMHDLNFIKHDLKVKKLYLMQKLYNRLSKKFEFFGNIADTEYNEDCERIALKEMGLIEQKRAELSSKIAFLDIHIND